MENFEALGRYVYNVEQATRNLQLRAEILNQIKEYIENVVSQPNQGYFAKSFDSEKIGILADRAGQHYFTAIHAIEEANKYAKLCDKPIIKVQEFN